MTWWDPYIASTQEHVPEADGTIVFDNSMWPNIWVTPSTTYDSAIFSTNGQLLQFEFVVKNGLFAPAQLFG